MTTTTQLIRQVIGNTGLVDPREIAEVVADRTPDSEVRGFYAKMLVQEVRMHLSNERRNIFSQAGSEPNPDTDPTVGKSGLKPLGKARTRATVARDWWADFTSTRVHVGQQSWKLLGDCTFDDLRSMHDERASHADRVLQEAHRFDVLSKLLEEEGVESVGLLDAVKVRAVFV